MKRIGAIVLTFFTLAALEAISPAAKLNAAPAADQPVTATCNQYMAPKKTVSGKSVGQEECVMQDHGVVDATGKYHRIEMGVTGTLSGYIVKEGARSNHFTSAPDFIFTHYGNKGQRFHGTLRYEAAKGTSITLLYPETGWNGKMYVMVHGSGGSFLMGSMKRWDLYFNPEKPMADVTKYEMSMLRKGYAVARTKRNAERDGPGDYDAVLDDGTVWPSQNVAEIPELILDEARLVKNFLKDRLGRAPTRAYWYGHSGGAMMGTLINYMSQMNPDLNKDAGGVQTIDGFLWDDVGGGQFIPFLLKDGQDILFKTADQKARFFKSIEIAHQAYPNAYTSDQGWEMDIPNLPERVSPVYLVNKRTRAKMMHDKGLDANYRYYEVRGISHSGGDSVEGARPGDVNMLNLSRFMDSMVDVMDAWVEKGIAPPPSRADADIAGTGAKKDAVAMPETACPLGVYHAYPQSRGTEGVALTGLAEFTGEGVEPVDGRVQHVDMNGNGKRDKRETVTQAWRRLGLLKATDTFSADKYVACVEGAIARLQKDRFLTDEGGKLYLEEAQKKDVSKYR
jgi:hypothetical protein